MDYSIEEIINFVIANGNGLYSEIQRDRLEEVIRLHLKYKTCIIVRDKQNTICAVARWNITGYIATIFDTIVRPDYRSYKRLKMLIALGISRNPHIRFLRFKREIKYPGRKPKLYSVVELLKRSK